MCNFSLYTTLVLAYLLKFLEYLKFHAAISAGFSGRIYDACEIVFYGPSQFFSPSAADLRRACAC